MECNDYQNYFGSAMAKFWQNQNFDAMKAIAGRNLEASIAANKLFMEGLQVVAKRQAEVFQNAAKRSVEFCKKSACSTSPEEVYKLQCDSISEAVENMSGVVGEIVEMSLKAGLEIFNVCNKRTCDATREVNAVAKNTNSNKA
ncbi:TIGR01841 family phasin [Rickettsiales endosymbiont of Peranema trichophorum]|uniref:TIGR01841 family phasin n=1 Tax=Rickettsiales endosymbiont of Peranema trichophorum TaxID=2486577 RepID=UPI0013EE82C6|nr:TIGR01841 family phasin [Rickettsiales endosymbiont of Peranema trichophorum]